MAYNSLSSTLEPCIKLTVAYDGGSYLGWQKTKEGPSIQQELEYAFCQIFQRPIAIEAASRTDAGVHAEGQIVACTIPRVPKDLPTLRHSLNALLPCDIAVLEVEAVEPGFHPTTMAAAKEYRYALCLAGVMQPKWRGTHWHCPAALNLLRMQQAADILVGTHDFKAFCNYKKNDNTKDHIRTVREISLHPLSCDRLEIRVTGNHFLYKMVRNIVGTLVHAGKGKISPEELEMILFKRDRTLAGPTAPAHGLTLFKVYYNNESDTR